MLFVAHWHKAARATHTVDKELHVALIDFLQKEHLWFLSLDEIFYARKMFLSFNIYRNNLHTSLLSLITGPHKRGEEWVWSEGSSRELRVKLYADEERVRDDGQFGDFHKLPIW